MQKRWKNTLTNLEMCVSKMQVVNARIVSIDMMRTIAISLQLTKTVSSRIIKVSIE